MTTIEFNSKLAELKELAAKAEAIALELQEEARKQQAQAAEAVEECLLKSKEMDKAEYRSLSQAEFHIAEVVAHIETATYKLTEEVIGNLNKI